MKDIYLVESVRTGIARAGKNSWFSTCEPTICPALVINELIRRTGLEDKKEQIGDVIWGERPS
jgi:acetyl-CoA acyltransferase